ncbi:type 11 methyltransferase [Cystobacter fuscus]|uniref:Type 11 methyltransferase n=1 Tax=Cystobacter fuscus TaxID=43 RepID=A0A250JB31_9BACT|nr:methyltransferase domain-containing protein [Cystobacter fuscus]ATB40790.1 type 11 methyltransferase [Cystobacter fuscus]
MSEVQYTAEGVGRYYDVMAQFYQTVWGDSIHMGFWPDPTDATVSMSQAQKNFTDLMISHMGLQPGQRALDVGCGTGRPAIQLARATNTHVTAISISQSQIATATGYARESGVAPRAQAQGTGAGSANATDDAPTARFELVDAMAMPYRDGTFDAAWAFESIFHMPSRLQVFREMARVVRPGGRVVVADFVTLRPLTSEESAIAYPAFAANDLASLEDYVRDLKQVGLTNISCRDVTANTFRPSNRATYRELQTEAALGQLRKAYGHEQADAFRNGWSAIEKVNETLGYVLIQADKP